MTENDIRELLRELRDEPVPADSLRRVRIATAGRTARRVFPCWRSAALAVAAASVVLLFVLARKPAPAPASVAAPQPTPAVVAREQAPAVPVEKPAGVARVRPESPPVVQRAKRSPAVMSHTPAVAAPAVQAVKTPPITAPDVVIRIETADPDVVILLVGD